MSGQPDQLDQAAIRAWWRRTRERQGLPPTFSDATIGRLVALALAGRQPAGRRRREGGPPAA